MLCCVVICFFFFICSCVTFLLCFCFRWNDYNPQWMDYWIYFLRWPLVSTYLTWRPKHGCHVMPCWRRIKRGPGSLHFLIMMWFSPQISTLSPNRDTIIFNTFLSLPLSLFNNSHDSTPLLPLLWQWNQSMEFWRGVRHIIGAQATQTARGPILNGLWWTCCHLKRTCLTCLSLTTVCVCQVEHWGAVQSFLSRSALLPFPRCRALAICHHG